MAILKRKQKEGMRSKKRKQRESAESVDRERREKGQGGKQFIFPLFLF